MTSFNSKSNFNIYIRNVPLYSLIVGLLFGGQCATFGTCLALICTKNRLKSLEVTVI